MTETASTLIKIADSQWCPVERYGVITVPLEFATIRCLGAQKRQPCASLRCPGIALSQIALADRALELHLRQMGATFRERNRVRGYEPLGDELWIHGPFPSLNLRENITDPNTSMLSRIGKRIPDPRLEGLAYEHPEDALPMVIDTDDTHYADYRFIGRFMAKEQTITTLGSWKGDRSGIVRIPIGAEL